MNLQGGANEAREVDAAAPSDRGAGVGEPALGAGPTEVAQPLEKGQVRNQAGLAGQAGEFVVGVDQVRAQAAQPALQAPEGPVRRLRLGARLREQVCLTQEAGIERELERAAADLVGAARYVGVGHRRQRHDQQVLHAAAHEREQRRVRAVAAVPVRLAVDHDGLLQRRQAGRREQRIDAQAGGVEQAQAPAVRVGRRDEQPQRAGPAQALEVDLLGEHLAQRVQAERVELVRREQLRPVHEQACRRHQTGPPRVADREQVEGHALADRRPEAFERGTRAVGPTVQQALGERDRVHRTGAGAADRRDGQAVSFEQVVEHAPGEGAVRTAALQREAEGRAGIQQGAGPVHVATPRLAGSVPSMPECA